MDRQGVWETRQAVAAGVAMSLGWGLRGSIGGGPLGALIPGAMVVLTICALRGHSLSFALRAGAIGAVAVSFGGEMTYGQTIGLLRESPTFWWGLLGLTLKGAVWGLVAAPVVWVAMRPNMLEPRSWWPGLGLLVVGAAAGWKLVNEPKLIYFSNRLDRPRPEIWCGLLFGGLLLTAWLAWSTKDRAAVRAGLLGLVSGGFGFGLGSLIMLAVNAVKGPDGWKAMELFFGFCFGVGLSLIPSEEPAGELNERRPLLTFVLCSLLLTALAIGSEDLGLARYSWAVTGAVILAVVPYVPSLWRPGAMALPFLPVLLDFVESATRPQIGWRPELCWALAAGGAILFLPLAWRTKTAAGSAFLVSAACTIDAYVKFFPSGLAVLPVVGAFTILLLLMAQQLRGAASGRAAV